MRRFPRFKWPKNLARHWKAVAAAVAVFATAAATAAIHANNPSFLLSSASVAPELRAEVENAKDGETVQALMMLPNAPELTGGREKVLSTLRKHASETQAEVEQHLADSADVTVVNRFWITNMLLVEFPARTTTLNSLAAIPGVQQVIPNFKVTALEPVQSQNVSANAELTWGLEKIEAKRVWDELGVTGNGVRVATLDTGVEITHPDLAGKMVTDDPNDPNYPGGWMEFDSSGNLVASAPHDSAYHGTHVAGTIHGGDTSGTAIGVAPGAEMMHGLVIPGGGGSFAQVAAGMQWAIAPTDVNGNPVGQPADVVNMSLGGNGLHQVMVQPTRAMRAAGTFPAFAIGNNCGSSGTASPGNVYDAVGVGATDVNDDVASFSCGGVINKSQWDDPPADWPDSYVKPDISAPGVDVLSADPNGSYRTLSGTSMATPHTAGTVALMLSGGGDLPVNEVADVLADTAFWDDRYAPSPPDTRYGHGRINAFEAVSFVSLDSGIEGTVTDKATGDPVKNATITVEPGGRQVVTKEDGTFTTRLAPGTYTVKVTAFGYETESVTDVQVSEGSFATADVALTARPTGQISGTATLELSGGKMPGVTVRVLGVPTDLSAQTGTDGTYTITGVPEGTYRVAATHPMYRGSDPVEVTVTAGQTATADFTFAVPRSVAIVDESASRAAQYQALLEPYGYETAVYDWSELDQAAQHAVVITGYGLTSDYDPDEFGAFLAATDANGTGVIFTDHAFGTGQGIRQLSQHTGQPASTGSDSNGAGQAETYFDVTAEHPVLGDASVGDRIVFDNTTSAKWLAWFDGYEGDGRQIIATVGRTADGTMGGGIGVDQRANNRHVLLSVHGVSATRGPADWTEEATDLFFNAINWVAPPVSGDQPYYSVHGLNVSPDVVKGNEEVTVTADVTNIGSAAGTYNAALRVGGTDAGTVPVELDPGQTKTATWKLNPADYGLGTFEVQIAGLTDRFRVRAPKVELSATTVDTPRAAAAGPLADATVELIEEGGTVHSVGTTDADGTLSFEIPAPAGTYTLVVRKQAPEGGGDAYLLHRKVTVDDDMAVSFAPKVEGSGGDTDADSATRAELELDAVSDRHAGWVYLRPASTAPHGFLYRPGTLIASLGQYEAVTVHQIKNLERDWFLPSRIVTGLAWTESRDTTFTFGGAAEISLSDVTVDDAGKAALDWDVTDAHGVSFATVLAGEERPFLDLPERTRLEDVEGLVRAAAASEVKPVLRLYNPQGTEIRAGSINWNARPYPLELGADIPDGTYGLKLEVGTGGYSGDLSAQANAHVGPPPAPQVSVSDTRGAFDLRKNTEFDVTATNSGNAGSGPMTYTVRISGPDDLRAKDVTLRLKDGPRWKAVRLTGGDGVLTAKLVSDVDLAAGASQTWRLSLRIEKPGNYQITDTFTGDGIEVHNTDEVSVGEPVAVGHP